MSFITQFFQRNSIYVATIFGGAFAFQTFFDVTVTKWYENHNKGKLWKDVKVKFLEGAGEEEDDE
ncbi:putative subunit of the ubiquinol-cytochrome c reductase complex [Scheffersomyces coipomensis]|uniref:putative subunit of the ubiquinol-cytochrome c reductase complex n=1 Tax=Scheffersomyces coipomensis TaxID=1788519 RepID=UPI00315C9A46